MREEMMLARETCGPEFRAYCQNVPLGGGRAMQCLEANAASLSPGCKRALMEMPATDVGVCPRSDAATAPALRRGNVGDPSCI
jgi:hypothetical protein